MGRVSSGVRMTSSAGYAIAEANVRYWRLTRRQVITWCCRATITGLTQAEMAVPVAATSVGRAGEWRSAAALAFARTDHTATLLDDGTVLVIGGYGANMDGGLGPALATTERYDPETDRWTPLRDIPTRRGFHTATLLPDRRVLVVGGAVEDGGGLRALTATEIYDPRADTWARTAPLPAPRAFHTATVLDDGRVLVVGGGELDALTANATMYDATTESWLPASRPANARTAHTATRMPSGRILVAGGNTGNGSAVADVEVYIPETNRWTSIPAMRQRRESHTATLLDDQRLLIVGGREEGSAGNVLDRTELFDHRTGRWSPGPPLRTGGRADHLAILMTNGQVVIAGGSAGFGVTVRTTEVFLPSATYLLPTALLAVGRTGHAVVSLRDGGALVVGGGNDQGVPLDSVERYTPLLP